MGIFKKLLNKAFAEAIGKKAFTNNPYLGLVIDADESDVIADELFSVGFAYKNGDFMLPQDNNKALYYFKKSAERGHVTGELFTAMGLMRYDDDHNDEVMHWLQNAAEQGERQAMYNLGISYHRGDINGQVDVSKSFNLFRRAAEKGYWPSCERLASIYWNGSDGIGTDRAKAKFWALESCGNNEDDNDDSILKAFFTEEDFVNGKINTTKIFNEAAEAGEPHAMYKIGNAFIEKDLTKAVELWTNASDLGSLYAKCNLGSYYGKEKKDYKMANRLFEKAAKFGVEEAQHALAEFYCLGLGVEKDMAMAWRWNEKAINFGYTPARYLLAIMCLQNDITEILPDKVMRGMSYMNQAAQDNYPPALEYFKKYNEAVQKR